MERINGYIKNILNSIKYASILCAVLIVLGTAFGIITTPMSITKSLENIKALLFAAGSIGLLISAMSILKKGKGEEKEVSSEWKNKFGKFTYHQGVVLISTIIILYGCIFDYIIYYMKSN